MRLLSALALLVLVSCTGSPVKSSKLEYIQGDTPAGVTYEEMKKNLTRDFTNYQAGYAIEALLYTKPLLESEEGEKGKREMNPQEEIQAKQKKAVHDFVETKTCFLISLDSLTLESTTFKMYAARMEDSSGKIIPLQFDNLRGVNSVPFYSRGMGGYPWHNMSHACSEKPIDVSKGVKLHFILSHEDKPNSVLVWNVGNSSSRAQASIPAN